MSFIRVFLWRARVIVIVFECAGVCSCVFRSDNRSQSVYLCLCPFREALCASLASPCLFVKRDGCEDSQESCAGAAHQEQAVLRTNCRGAGPILRRLDPSLALLRAYLEGDVEAAGRAAVWNCGTRRDGRAVLMMLHGQRNKKRVCAWRGVFLYNLAALLQPHESCSLRVHGNWYV